MLLALATAISRPIPRSSSHRKTTSSCAASASPIVRGSAGRSTSPATAEVVIAPAAADELHPAFSNLFVQTEILRERRAILCTRRPRSLGEQAPWMLHLMTVRGADAGEAVLRDRSAALHRPHQKHRLPLGDGRACGAFRIVRARCWTRSSPSAVRSALDPEQSATIDMVSGMAETRDMALSLVDKYQDRHLSDRVFDLAWTHSQVVLRQLNATEADAQLYARLASSVIYANASMRADRGRADQESPRQSGLWGYAISGDLPIVLLQIGDAANIDLVRQLVQAHAYWRLKGLAVDLVIWNEDHAGYRQRLQAQIMGLHRLRHRSERDRPAGRHLRPRSAEQISSEDRILLQSVARAVISDSRGTLAEQLDQHGLAEPRVARSWWRRAPQGAEGSFRRDWRQGDCAQRSDPVQRPGRLHPDGKRICHRPGARTGDAGTVGQRTGESGLRDPVVRRVAPPTPGARTRTNSASPPGTTTRSAMRQR
jgi:cyclic beta-1,2-glucan synthetase